MNVATTFKARSRVTVDQWGGQVRVMEAFIPGRGWGRPRNVIGYVWANRVYQNGKTAHERERAVYSFAGGLYEFTQSTFRPHRLAKGETLETPDYMGGKKIVWKDYEGERI